MALIDTTMARRHLDGLSSSTSDEELQLWVDAATSAVEKARGEAVDEREFVDEVAVVGRTVTLAHIPVVSLLSVVAVDTDATWDVGVLRVSPSGVVTAISGPALQGTVLVTYTAGQADPPAPYKVAGLIILQHLWETRRGTMGPRHGGDDEMYVPQLGYAVPRRAVELLGLSLPGVA
ncbi:hypothetical protein [Streptomyces sp. NPDC020983]|uniref:hypothetical protein n=1 Tax=Streptomyces sp. NPDC020983 TaxID=3365106 RepID=UPI0037A14BED